MANYDQFVEIKDNDWGICQAWCVCEICKVDSANKKVVIRENVHYAHKECLYGKTYREIVELLTGEKHPKVFVEGANL